MSDTFDHYADAIDNYMDEQWDGACYFYDG